MPRILSDLHLFDAATRIQSLDALQPLLEGVDELVLNGDSLDTQHGMSPDQLAAIKNTLGQLAPRVILLSGNHDPDLTSQTELMLCEGRVWVTHGDILFPDLTPWSAVRPTLANRIAAARREVGDTAWADLATRLRLYRAACMDLPYEFDRSSRSFGQRVSRLMHTFFPPTRILAMANAWSTAPRRARALVTAHRPTAQVVINGHIHFPSVSRRAGQPTVVNTGSFTRPLGGYCADVSPTAVTVRRIREINARFHPGPLVAEIPLAPLPPAR